MCSGIKKVGILIFGILLFMSCNKKEEQGKPNIIYILADDLGYGELGSYGQQIIETPNLDSLALSGMKFTQHYSGAPVCAPARCILLTGKHSGHADIRGNDEWASRGEVWSYEAMFRDPNLEGQRPMRDSTITIAEMLKANGYVTGMVGKWGLGAPLTESTPNKQGFDFFYGYNCQRQAHTLYPMHLWKNENKVILNNKFVALHANLPEGSDPNDPDSYTDFQLNDYAPELMHNEALQFLETVKDHPFFLYYASPLPHVPLQAPQKWVDFYKNKIKENGPYTGKGYFPNQFPRATYAAMISYLDEQIGDLVKKLKSLGIYENTLIIFTSDNGPTYAGGADTEFFNSARPFSTSYGKAKGFVYEGGIRVPMIASWPNSIAPGTSTHHISSFYDVFATFEDLIHIREANKTDGLSFLPTLTGHGDQKKHEYLYWEFPEYKGQIAIRMGKWKGIIRNIKEGNLSLELFNIEEDSLELYNLADQYPEITDSIIQIMFTEHEPPIYEKFRLPIFD